jgi:hypothetical protein
MARTGHCLLTARHQSGEDWVEVEWTLDAAILHTMQRLVPAADRTWDAARGCWTIRARHGISPHAWENVQRCRPRPSHLHISQILLMISALWGLIR